VEPTTPLSELAEDFGRAVAAQAQGQVAQAGAAGGTPTTPDEMHMVVDGTFVTFAADVGANVASAPSVPDIPCSDSEENDDVDAGNDMDSALLESPAASASPPRRPARARAAAKMLIRAGWRCPLCFGLASACRGGCRGLSAWFPTNE